MQPRPNAHPAPTIQFSKILEELDTEAALQTPSTSHELAYANESEDEVDDYDTDDEAAERRDWVFKEAVPVDPSSRLNFEDEASEINLGSVSLLNVLATDEERARRGGGALTDTVRSELDEAEEAAEAEENDGTFAFTSWT